jgi:hypothetical protein
MTDTRAIAPLQNDILTVEEVAAMLKTSPKQVRRLPLPVVRLSPRTLRYLREDVLNYCRRLAEQRGAA